MLKAPSASELKLKRKLRKSDWRQMKQNKSREKPQSNKSVIGNRLKKHSDRLKRRIRLLRKSCLSIKRQNAPEEKLKRLQEESERKQRKPKD